MTNRACMSIAGRTAVGAAALALVVGTAAHAQQTQGQQAQQNRGAQQSQPTQTMGVDRSSAIIVGEVVETRNVNIARPVKSTHRLIKIKSRNGRTAVVDIGNADQYAQVNFNRGDRIIAVGKKARINDQPVLFAKSVGELYSVGNHLGSEQMTGQTGGQAQRQSAQGATGQQPATMGQQAQQQTDQQARASGQSAAEGDGAVIYLFESDNLASDDYGLYDEDFAWQTNDQWYSDWNDVDPNWNEDYEQAHYDMFGYDDAGEWGFWDW